MLRIKDGSANMFIKASSQMPLVSFLDFGGRGLAAPQDVQSAKTNTRVCVCVASCCCGLVWVKSRIGAEVLCYLVILYDVLYMKVTS